MQDLKISVLQTDLHWENPIANLAMLEEKIWKIGEPTDLILLPEMFTSGFTMNAAKVAERIEGNAFRWMKQMAKQTNAVLVGSFVVEENLKFYNRLFSMFPDGQYQFYDKRHLFRMAKEHEVFTAGQRKIILTVKGWKICPLVCYDLRFPVWSRNVGSEYDLLLYVANWPSVRVGAWDALLRARAIENISYVAGANRIGVDGKNIDYTGHSSIIDFKGEILKFNEGGDVCLTYKLSQSKLSEFREKFPAHLDSDEFKIASE